MSDWFCKKERVFSTRRIDVNEEADLLASSYVVFETILIKSSCFPHDDEFFFLP